MLMRQRLQDVLFPAFKIFSALHGGRRAVG
jgi:hypothetical protein